MKLFEVTRWGNDTDGGNGPDTNYLVCARDHKEAAALVRPLEPVLSVVTELGISSVEIEVPFVLRGPYIQHNLDGGARFTYWSWDLSGLEVWMPTARCRDGEATCHYANGQLAARCRWQRDRQHGTSELWYSNGRPMHRGEYRRGRRSGVHKYWYADGTPASRYEHSGEGVRSRRWDRDGREVADVIDARREDIDEWGETPEALKSRSINRERP